MNKNEKAIEDAAIKLVANAYVEKEGEKIIEEAKKINQMEKITDEEVTEFERFCGKEFAKQERKERLYNLTKVAVAAIAVFIFVSGICQFGLTYNNPVVDEKGTKTTTIYNGKDYFGDKRYAPTYMPKGFIKKDDSFDKNIFKIRYIYQKDSRITFYYGNIKNIEKTIINDNYKIVDINGSKAKVTSTPSEAIVKIEWEKGEHIFCIEAQGVDEEEVIKVAKSVKSVK